MSWLDEAMQRNAAHMEAVRAVHRRSAYERVLSKIAYYEKWCRDEAQGIDPPMTPHEHTQLKLLRELRDALRAEMILHGQIEPA